MADPVAPGDTIGILGGGQLGRMLAVAAAGLGLKSHVYCPDPDSPAFDVAAAHTIADYGDEAAVASFAASVPIVTFEFENVPIETADVVGRHGRLAPGARALATTQDRLVEKRFVAGLGIPTAPFRPVAAQSELRRALAELGAPAILKTRRFGYDGKGQVRIGSPDEAADAWAQLGGAPAILEGVVPFSREVSVVAVRGRDGAFRAYDSCWNEHRAGILYRTRVPSGLPVALEKEAGSIAKAIADALDYVGVLAVEMFLLPGPGGETLAVNEIAPRVHNSGHWTIEGADTSQFEQHVRAVCGWPLGSAGRAAAADMTNLIGDEIESWPAILGQEGAHLHHYGKRDARPGRKMGHVTRLSRLTP